MIGDRNISIISDNDYNYIQQQNITTTSEEDKSIFFDSNTDKNDVTAELTDNIGIKTNKDLISEYDSADWEIIEPKKNNSFFGGTTYIYKTSNGSTVKVKNTDNIQVKVNSKTGEIVVIGANNADIDVAKGQTITIVESTVDEITTNGGNEVINIKGAHTTVTEIDAGKGRQIVNVSDGARVEEISTGKGNDKITLENGASAGDIFAGAGDDEIIIKDSKVDNNIQSDAMFCGLFSVSSGKDSITIENSQIAGKIKSGLGNDNINVNNSTLDEKVLSGWGNDNINITNSEVSENIETGFLGNDHINIEDSSIQASGKIRTGIGRNTLDITNSEVDGTISASINGGGELTLNVTNSTVKSTKNFDINKVNATITDSAVRGIDQASNSFMNGSVTRNITSLDTTSGEYEGYKKLQPIKTDGERVVYSLDGLKIEVDNDGAEIYINNNGDIVINGADNAEINGEYSSKITVLNSNIITHKNIDNTVEYKNCIVDGVYVKELSTQANVISDNSNITVIVSNNASSSINLKNESVVKKIIGSSVSSTEIEVQLTNSEVDKIYAEEQTSLNIVTSQDNSNSKINEIESEYGNINANLSNVETDTIKTTDGSVDIKAANSQINEIKNENDKGTTNIELSNVTLDKITSNSQSNIELDNCRINEEIETSDNEDIVKANNSNIQEVQTNDGNDNVVLNQSTVDELTTNGILNIIYSDINDMSAEGDIAIIASEIESIDLEGKNNNLFAQDSLIQKGIFSTLDDNVYMDNFGTVEVYNNSDNAINEKTNFALSILNEAEEENIEELYNLIAEIVPEEINNIISQSNQELTKEEILKSVLENSESVLKPIQEQLVLEMQCVIKTMEEEIKDKKASEGIIGSVEDAFDNEENELNSKKAIFAKIQNSNDLTKILKAYKIITNNNADADLIKETQKTIEYTENIDDETIDTILYTLNYIGNDLEYQMNSQDGAIKDIIAQINNVIDIGTTKNEVKAYLSTFRKNVEDLKNKYNNGEISKSEFAVEYKRITGHNLTEENVTSLIDIQRGNDEFNNDVQEKIQDYQETQQQIFQIGEFVITIAAGTLVSIASGGAAGPAVAAILGSFGQMGMALTATTVSFAVKMGIEATERCTNSIVADNITPEEIAKTAALTYAGCLCGQFGNAVGDFVRGGAPQFLAKFISSKEIIDIITKVAGKTFEIGADTLASVGSTALITGSGEFNEEFYQNIQSELIGLIQSKITHAYFNNHPELQLNVELYKTRKALVGLSEVEANAEILKKYGFSDVEAAKYSGMSSKEVDALVGVKLLNNGEISFDETEKIENENSSITETTEPKLTTPEEQRTRLLELKEIAQKAGIENIDDSLADYASSEAKADLFIKCIDAGINDSDDIKVLLSLSDEQISAAMKSGITDPETIYIYSSLSNEEQRVTFIELKEIAQSVGIEDPSEIAVYASSEEKANLFVKCIDAGIKDIDMINKISSLPNEEQRVWAFEIREIFHKAGISCSETLFFDDTASDIDHDLKYYLADFVSSEEQVNFIKECINSGVKDFHTLKKLNSLTEEGQRTRFFELREVAQNSGITDVDNYLADFVSSEEQANFIKECINSGVNNIYALNKLNSLTEEVQRTRFFELREFVQNAGITAAVDSYLADFVSSEEQANFIKECINSGIKDFMVLEKVSCFSEEEQRTRFFELREVVKNAGITEDVDIYLADFVSSEEQANFIKECINIGVKDFHTLKKLNSLTEEGQRIRFLELKEAAKKAGITNIDDSIVDYAACEEQYNLFKKCINADIKNEQVILKLINSFSEEQRTRFFELREVAKNADIPAVVDSYLADYASSEEKANLFKKCLNVGIKNINVINTIISLPNEKLIARFFESIETYKDVDVNKVLAVIQDDTKFETVTSLIQKGIKAVLAFDYVYLNKDPQLMSLSEKVEFLNILIDLQSAFKDIPGVEQDLMKINIQITDLNKELNQTIIPTDVTFEAQKSMFQGFFANNNPKLEETLSSTNFSKFETEGIPLSYSRKEFLSDLCKTLDGLPADQQADILKRLGITPAQGGLQYGYNGIINVNTKNSELDLTNPVEAKVFELANKFIRENSVHTGDEALDEALNALIHGMPEFINVIGKQQHGDHELSVDAHILKVLQEAMSNEKYQNLSTQDKTILKLSIILHDIAKSEGIADKDHPIASALYARNILEKYSMPIEMRDRIFELIKHHHWLEYYNKNEINADYAATMFRHKDDFLIAQIMAEADLKGVSEGYYNIYKEALDNIGEIYNSLDKINQTGQIVFTSKIIQPDLIPLEEYNGQTYRVINFSQLPSDFDLSQYGFNSDITLDSLRLYVHMVPSAKNLEVVDILTDVSKGGFLCASYISLTDKSTYDGDNRRIGVSLEVENENIANAGHENQRSGIGVNKSFQSLSNIITGHDSSLSKHRNIIPETIKQELNLTEEEYKLFYEQFAEVQYETQIKDDKEYTIGSRTFMGADIKDAIRKANDNLILIPGNTSLHNESNLYNPKINAVVTKYNSLEELAAEHPDILEFALKHNLPIYLLGE